jgi:hypothetical protein
VRDAFVILLIVIDVRGYENPLGAFLRAEILAPSRAST